MQYHKTKPHVLPLIALVVTSLLAAALPYSVEAGDVGVASSTGGIVEIRLESAVAGSTVVRSLPSQEGAPGTIRIIDVTANTELASGSASSDGQYTIVFPPAKNQLFPGQRIQAINLTKGYYSSTVIVSAAQPPAIN